MSGKPQSLNELSRELGWPEPGVELLSEIAIERIRVLCAERDRYREVLEFVSDYCNDEATVGVVDNALRQCAALDRGAP